MNRPLVFHLKRGDELLAILESCKPGSEMFWATCDFKPTDAFSAVEPLFREASDSADMDVFERNYNKLIEMGVVLINIEREIEIKYFVLHPNGARVELRYAEPPYLSDEPTTK